MVMEMYLSGIFFLEKMLTVFFFVLQKNIVLYWCWNICEQINWKYNNAGGGGGGDGRGLLSADVRDVWVL